jgi:hypothetical protein
MKAIKYFVALIILSVAFGAALFTQRVTISELVNDWSAPALPEAISYDDVVNEVVEVVLEEAEDVLDVIEEIKEVDKEDVVDEGVVTEVKEDVVLEDVIEDSVEDPIVVLEDELPTSINLAVPFTSQAPHAVWDNPYKEACEEASLYMVHRYFEGEPAGLIEATKADEELLRIVAFEEGLFGFFEDTTAQQTATLAEVMYGREYELVEDPTAEDIKRHVAAGRPVIVPSAGRLLGNPYFTAPGPVYHMLVVRGYTASNQFIVNDPGTSRGEEFIYDVDTIMDAMHDWNGGDEITEGKKVVLVLYP